jgi:hypothetical protein
MLSLPPSVRLFVATQPVDGRKGADSLMVIVRDVFRHDPFLCVVVRNVAAEVSGGRESTVCRCHRGPPRHISVRRSRGFGERRR